MTESTMPATDTASLTLILALAAALILLAIEPTTHKPSRPRPAPAPKNGAAANHLMGQVTRAQLAAHPGWGQLDGRGYIPDAATLARLKDYGEDVRALVFMGTWCIDSVREMPRFLRVVDALGWPEERLAIYALDRSKRDAEGLAERWRVAAIPTFIVLHGESELGRIVERSQRSLEADLLDIVERRLLDVARQQDAGAPITPY